jgi:hypothetical protein
MSRTSVDDLAQVLAHLADGLETLGEPAAPPVCDEHPFFDPPEALAAAVPGPRVLPGPKGHPVPAVPQPQVMWDEQANQPRDAQPMRPARRQSTALRGFLAPILITFGLVVLAPAVWAALLLTGHTVPGGDLPDADSMARMMLAALPIGTMLLCSGLVFLWQAIRG